MRVAPLEIGEVKRGVQARMRRTGMAWLMVVACLALFPAPRVVGQLNRPSRDPDSFLNQQRALEEKLRREFDSEMGERQRTLFDWGGWYNTYLFVFDDGIDSSRTLRRHDLRLWGRLSIDDGIHQFYARARLSMLDFNSGDSYDGDDDDVEGPNLERGYYRLDLAKWLRASGRSAGDYELIVKAGRDLVQFGTGVALATPLDQVWIQGIHRSFELSAFAGKTVGSTQDFDLSRRASRTHRNLYGAQLRYRGFEHHEPFVYVFHQEDRNHDTFLPLLQRFDYDSSYIGIGSTGELAERWRYSTEWVYEFGTSYGHRRYLADNDISAWSVLAELEYLFPGEHKARASVEYLFGSGDPDRLGSPTNTIGGNTRDREDSGFIGFGYRDTGLVLAPRYSNLHMWRAGASCYPWPHDERFGRLAVGTDWYLFYKHHGSAAISDPTATRQSGYLGFEMDFYANWRMTSDLSWTTRFGAFFPGDACEDSDPRTFLLVGVTWSF